jgi:hypothetical protein
MRSYVAGLAVATTALVFAQSCAALSSMGRADARLQDGEVCFSVHDERSSGEAAEIHAVSVSGPKESPKEAGRVPLVWSFWVKKNRPPLRLTPETCLKYGVAAEAIADQTVPPQALKHGLVYTVFLNGRRASEESLLGYRAEFCIALDEAGKLQRVVVVPLGPASDARRYQVCSDL